MSQQTERDSKEETKPIKVAALNEDECSLWCKWLRIDASGTICLAYGRLSHDGEHIFRAGDCRNVKVIRG